VSIQEITNFSEKAKADAEIGGKLKECQKIKELIALGSEYGFTLDEVDLYPPNEPQFVAEQLSEKLEKALLRM
jgi:predicted ribosomally synthesized peptide with nif11-like leader